MLSFIRFFRVVVALLTLSVSIGKSASSPAGVESTLRTEASLRGSRGAHVREHNPYAGYYSGKLLADFGLSGGISIHVGDDGAVSLSAFLSDGVAKYSGSGVCSTDGDILVNAINASDFGTSQAQFTGALVKVTGGVTGSGAFIDNGDGGFGGTWTATPDIWITDLEPYRDIKGSLERGLRIDIAGTANVCGVITLSGNVGGNALPPGITIPIDGGDFSVSKVLPFKSLGLKPFSEDQKVEITATIPDGNGGEESSSACATIHLPIIMIPGIDPLLSQRMGGDGTWKSLESNLDGLKTPYETIKENPIFPTLSTLIYNRNFESFNAAARELDHTIYSALQNTYASKCILIGHSKGCLVARAYLGLFGASQVKACLFVQGPHCGSVYAKTVPRTEYFNYDYANLSPLWDCVSYPNSRQYVESPHNRQLWNLNGVVQTGYAPYSYPTVPTTIPIFLGVTDQPTVSLDGKVSVATPIAYSLNNGVLIDVTLYYNGDGIVPTFSQEGVMFDTNNPDNPLIVLPAFQEFYAKGYGAKNILYITESHIDSMNSSDLFNSVILPFLAGKGVVN